MNLNLRDHSRQAQVAAREPSLFVLMKTVVFPLPSVQTPFRHVVENPPVEL
ncbi:unnamed protein product [Haemonchus placei]|uniref:Uncharacterized protein n=1 Tax=Haemonchus placei TaxID=6290 RepID=A0A0N4X5C8_HAEPC|nr:unnamed protein product [Haemonchus placei]